MRRVYAAPLRLLPNANEVCRQLVGKVGGTFDRRDHSLSQDDICAPRSSKVEPSLCINRTEYATPDLHLTQAESTSANRVRVERAVPICFIPLFDFFIAHTCYLAAPSGGELAFGQMGVLSPVLPEGCLKTSGFATAQDGPFRPASQGRAG